MIVKIKVPVVTEWYKSVYSLNTLYMSTNIGFCLPKFDLLVSITSLWHSEGLNETVILFLFVVKITFSII